MTEHQADQLRALGMMKSTRPEATAPLAAQQWLQAQPAQLQADCRALLLERLSWRFSDWVLRRQEPLTYALQAQLDEDVRRLKTGEPLAYVLGNAPFRNLLLTVSPDVLVPRPETELIVDHALRCLQVLAAGHGNRAGTSPLRVVDAGTGSGAIILGLANALTTQPLGSTVELSACDSSAEALQLARQNAEQAKISGVRWYQSDWLEAVPGTFDLLLSNPPYLAADDPHLPALAAEPREALVAGTTGLEDLQALSRQAANRLKPGGCVLLEHGSEQGQACRAQMEKAGLVQVSTHPDQYGQDRFSEGWRHA